MWFEVDWCLMSLFVVCCSLYVFLLFVSDCSCLLCVVVCCWLVLLCVVVCCLLPICVCGLFVVCYMMLVFVRCSLFVVCCLFVCVVGV